MMKADNTIISGLNPQYFWDVDFSMLDESSSSRLIIERVFTMGEVQEMNRLIRFYGREKVVAVLSNINYIDQKTLNFISKLFNKPLSEFKCYKLKQSKPQHWNL
ncbi:MAG: hypothetical protein V1775_19185 [Bacteroidota bacterium]